MRHWFIGQDERELTAYQVCKYSLERRSSVPVDVFPLVERSLRLNHLFTREQENYIDKLDGKPFSTQFSFTRFLVPEICRWNNISGWVGYSDCDFLFLANVDSLFFQCENLFKDKAVAVVKHRYHPKTSVKMDGMVQEAYPRKLWSSLIMWNMDHEANEKLTVREVNTRMGKELHSFCWIPGEDKIGNLYEMWNWVPMVSPTINDVFNDDDAMAVHFSLGTPDMPGYKDVPFAQHWRNELIHSKGPLPQRERVHL